MKNKPARPDMLNEYLQAVEGMKEAETHSFFYSKLKARMEKNNLQQEWRFPLKPAWMVAGLFLLLIINGFMVSRQFNNKDAVAGYSSLQKIAIDYNLTIPSAY